MSLSRFLNVTPQIDNSSSAITVFDDEGQGERPEYTPRLRVSVPAYNVKQGSVGSRSPKDFQDFNLAHIPGPSLERVKNDGRGLIYVGEVDLQTKIWEGWEFASLMVLPVLSFTDYTTMPGATKSSFVGGLAAWPIDPNTGERVSDADGPACKSKDGRAPLSRYVGGEVDQHDPTKVGPPNAIFDPRRKMMIQIGFDVKGNPIDPDFMCLLCPLSNFVKDGTKNLAPICKDNTEYIVFLPPQVDVRGRFMPAALAVIGGNASVSMALQGRGAGKSMSHKDPKKALLGLDEFKRPRTGAPRAVEIKIEVQVNSEGKEVQVVTNLTAKQLPHIIGFSETNDQLKIAEGHGYIPFPPKVVKTMDDFYEIMQSLTTSKEDGGYGMNIKYVVFSFKVYDFAPEGLPDVVGEPTPVYPLEMILVDNNAPKNVQRVPYLNVTNPDKPGTPEYIFPPITSSLFTEYMTGVLRSTQSAENEPKSYRELWEESSINNRDQVREKLASMGYGEGAVIEGQITAPAATAAPVVQGKLPAKASTTKTTPNADGED